MGNELLKGKGCLHVAVIVLALSLIGPVFAVDHFWTGAVSTNAADPNNWNNGTATPTLPSDSDIVRIGCTPDWQYFVPANQPVLTSEWNSRAGGPGAGWWLIMGSSENSVTIGDGAYIEWSHNDCTIRNGSILRVTGQRTGGGPSLVIAPRFRIGNNGDNVPTATGTVIVEKNGYLRLDPGVSRKGSGGWQIYMGSATKALIEIRDNGILELVQNATGSVIPRFVFGSADPAANKIIISGKGQLLLTGDTAAIATVADADTSLQSLIDMGLITTANPDEKLTFSGVNPTVVKLEGQRIANPNPADGESNLDRTAVLSWDPGTMTDKYDVYFGTDAAKVGEATWDNPLGVLKSQDQAETYYPLNGMLTLEYGQTYYWRVDEVNVPPDQTILKGKVWSFAAEPFVIPMLTQNITARASSQSPDQGPEKTIDRSGLDANDFHSTFLTDMWLSGNEKPVWIEYEFDKTYKISEMLVWNYNGEELLTALGLKDVTIAYSTDGVDQIPLNGVPAFEQAPGTADCTANTTVTFGDIAVKKVRITAESNWGNSPIFNKYGLSEVRFVHVPVAARQPSPTSGATDVAIDAVLSWRAGREANGHNVYLSTDQQAVTNGTAPPVTVYTDSYSPSSLVLDTTYFWRVDEVNEAAATAVWQGNIWSFSTQEYLTVEDFEDYNDYEPDRVFDKWADGYQNTSNGSQIGYLDATFLETVIVHGGVQSAPVFYDNTSANYSEVTVNTNDLAIGQDWTKSSPEILSLWFYGDPNNTATEQMYVKLNNSTKVIYNGEPADIVRPQWKIWNIDLTAFGINLSSVTQLSIGFERTAATGSSGVVFFDDIRLYRLTPAVASEEIWIEAEGVDMISEPMMVLSDVGSASGGQYVAAASGLNSIAAPPTTGVAKYTFMVQGGTYKISARVIIPSTNEDSFWLRIQGATTQTANHSSGWVQWNGIDVGSNWHWDDVHSSDDG